MDSSLSSFSISNSINKLDNMQDGYLTDVFIKGKTLVNLRGEHIKSDPQTNYDVNTATGIINAQEDSWQRMYFKGIELLKPNTTYTICLEVTEYTLNKEAKLVFFHDQVDSGGRNGYIDVGSSGTKIVKITTPQERYKGGIFIGTRDKSSGTIKFKNFMILEGDYMNSPPSYFEGIKSAGEVNYIDGKYIGKNLFKGEYQKKYIRGGDGNNGLQDDPNTRSAIVPIEAGGKYSIKKHSTSNRFTVCLYNSLESGAVATQSIDTSSSNEKITFTNTSNSKYIIIYVSNSNETPLLMVEKGDSFSDYEPYYEGNKIEILSIGKNLYRVDTAKFNGNDRIYTLSTNINVPKDVYAINNTDKRVIFGVKDKATNVFIRENLVASNSSFNFKLASNEYIENVTALFRDGWKESDLDYLKNNIMVTGVLDTKQEPYKSSKTEILLKEPLRNVGSISDVLNKDGTLVRELKQIIVNDETCNFSIWDKEAGYDCLLIIPKVAKKKVNYNGLLESFSQINNTIGGYWINSDNTVVAFQKGTKIEDMKKAVFGKKFIYQTEVPTIEQINKPLNIRTFKDGYIQQNTVIPATIEGKYSTNLGERLTGIMEVNQNMQKELGGVWRTLLSLADKSLRMKLIKPLVTETNTELKNKINEMLGVWNDGN